MEDSNNLAEIQDLRHEDGLNQKDPNFDYLFKVIAIGDPGSGKSCVLKRLIQNQFIEGQVTLGVEFSSFLVRVEDRVLKLQIWDTAGQENFRSVTKVFYRNTHAVVLCFPIDSRKAFENLKHWLNEIYAQCSPDVLVFLSGNKSDLHPMRQVPRELALNFQKDNELLYFLESSALEGTNITRLFIDMAKFLYVRFKEQMEQERLASELSTNNRTNSYQLSQSGPIKKEVGQPTQVSGTFAAAVEAQEQSKKDDGCC